MAKALILRQLMEKLGLSLSAFEREIGMGGGAISKSITRNSDISRVIADRILMRYPDINREWLETGDGEMFIKVGETSGAQ